MNFNTKGEEVPQIKFVNKYITPMSIVEATVSTEAIKSSLKGTPGLKLNFTTANVEGLLDSNGNPTGQTADHIFYLTEKTYEGKKVDGKFYPGVKQNLMMIADALGVRAQFDEVGSTATDFEDYANKIATILNGSANWKFGGEEIAGKDGKDNWTKATLAKYGFVESLGTNPSTLKLSNKDLKKLPVTDATTTNQPADTGSLY